MAYEKKVVEVKDRSGNVYGIGDTDLAEEVGNLNQAITHLPTEESGAALIAELATSDSIEQSLLTVLGWYLDHLPQNESAQDILDALTLEADRLAAVYEIWEAEREGA